MLLKVLDRIFNARFKNVGGGTVKSKKRSKNKKNVFLHLWLNQGHATISVGLRVFACFVRGGF